MTNFTFKTFKATAKPRAAKASDVLAGYGLVAGTNQTYSVFGHDAATPPNLLDISALATIAVTIDNAAILSIVTPPPTPMGPPPTPAMQFQLVAGQTPPTAGTATVTITPTWNDATKPALAAATVPMTVTLDPNSATGISVVPGVVAAN